VADKQQHKSLAFQSGAESNPPWLGSGKKITRRTGKLRAAYCPDNRALRCPLGAAMFSRPAWEEVASSLKLSGQELRIVHGIFDDCTEFAIADALKISPHTVHTHCERLYRKVGVTDRVMLVLRVMEKYVALTLSKDSALPPLCANFAAGRCPLRGNRI
jgi:DNA-binding CsgD family transcriptional regulator